MASDTYVKSGRGGAGNFIKKGQADSVTAQQAANDPEGQPMTADPAPTAPRETPEYIHTGRGGAGNWSKPEQPEKPLTPWPAVDKTVPDVQRKTGAVKTSGRGGWGHYTAFEDEGTRIANEREKAEDNKAQKEKIHDEVVKDVEAGLPAPPQAYLGAPAKVE